MSVFLGPRGGDLGRSLPASSASLASGDLLLIGDGLRRRVRSLDLDLSRRLSAGGDFRGDRDREFVMFVICVEMRGEAHGQRGCVS